MVSAVGHTTEELFKRASAYGEPTNEEAVARLVSTGDEAAALLGLALARAGIAAKLLGPEQIRLIAEGAPLDARLQAVSRTRNQVTAWALCATSISVGGRLWVSVGEWCKLKHWSSHERIG